MGFGTAGRKAAKKASHMGTGTKKATGGSGSWPPKSKIKKKYPPKKT